MSTFRRGIKSTMKIAGIILAGGKSSRYGKPKMFETYKGKCFYEYSVESLKDNSLSPIFISTNVNLLPCFKRDDVDFIIENENEAYQGPLFPCIMHYQRYRIRIGFLYYQVIFLLPLLLL